MESTKVLELSDKICKQTYGRGLYPYQRDFILSEAPFRLVLKARQLGMSTAVALEVLTESLVNPGLTTLLLSASDSKAQILLRNVKDFLKKIPSWESLVGNTDTRTELSLCNGSKIRSLTSNEDNARSWNADRVYLDEFSEMASKVNLDLLWSAVIPTTVRGGRVTVISTPRGRDKLYSLWVDEEDSWEKFKLPYTLCPDLLYQQNIEIQKKKLSPKQFSQEFECSFEVYQGSPWSVEELEGLTLEQASLQRGANIISWDPAKQVDHSVITGLNICNNRKTVFLVDEVSSLTYGEQAKKVLDYVAQYKAARVVIDAGGVGLAVAEHLSSVKLILTKVNFTRTIKIKTATDIKADCENKKFFIVQGPKTQRLKKDLLNFDFDALNWDRSKDGHSDYVASLMLAYIGASHRSHKVGFVDFPSRTYISRS